MKEQVSKFIQTTAPVKKSGSGTGYGSGDDSGYSDGSVSGGAL